MPFQPLQAPDFAAPVGWTENGRELDRSTMTTHPIIDVVEKVIITRDLFFFLAIPTSIAPCLAS